MISKLEGLMDTNTERLSIDGIIEAAEGIVSTLRKRRDEIDEEARRRGDFIFQARERAGEEANPRSLLAQLRVRAAECLGPKLVSSLWREMLDLCESIQTKPNANELAVFLEVAGYLFGQTIDAPPVEVNTGNVITATRSAREMAEIWPAIRHYLGLVRIDSTDPDDAQYLIQQEERRLREALRLDVITENPGTDSIEPSAGMN